MSNIAQAKPLAQTEQRTADLQNQPILSLANSRVWVMMPAYNEEAAIETLIRKISHVARHSRLDYEIVVVDDASTDRTAQRVSQLSFELPVRLIQHRENQGLAGAMRTGFQAVIDAGDENDMIVTLDADDTQPAATIPAMLTKIVEGYDVVVASRYQPGSRTVGVPAHRLMMTWFARWLFRIITPIPGIRDYTCGFRAYRLSALKQASEFYGEEFVSEKGFSCMVDFLLKMRRFDFIMGEVPMLLRYDQKAGASKMRVARTAMQTIGLLLKRRFGR